MSATVTRAPWPGWARAGLMFGVPAVVLVGGAYWAWSGRTMHAPAAPTKVAAWGRGATLPAPTVASLPAEHAAPSQPPPPAEVAKPTERVAPPVHVMKVWVDDKAIEENASQLAARREAARQQRQQAQQAAAEGARDPNVLRPGGGSEYARRMQATTFANTRPIPPDLNKPFTLKKGERIPCLPDQPISAGMVGPIKCVTTQAVWSMDHSNVLLPAFTEVNGTIEGGISNGGRRLFPIWTDMLTPKPFQLPIPLDAPSADEMGQPGLPGDVDTHFWLKARDLALVSIINMAGGVASSAASSGHGNNNLNLNLSGPENALQSLAERAFGGELSIPDTFYRGPGQPIVITTTKYIDLSNYYQNRVLR